MDEQFVGNFIVGLILASFGVILIMMIYNIIKAIAIKRTMKKLQKEIDILEEEEKKKQEKTYSFYPTNLSYNKPVNQGVKKETKSTNDDTMFVPIIIPTHYPMSEDGSETKVKMDNFPDGFQGGDSGGGGASGGFDSSSSCDCGSSCGCN